MVPHLTGPLVVGRLAQAYPSSSPCGLRVSPWGLFRWLLGRLTWKLKAGRRKWDLPVLLKATPELVWYPLQARVDAKWQEAD
jgi:hypothetical protein